MDMKIGSEVAPLPFEDGTLLFTTNPGLEDVTVEEFCERCEETGWTVTRAEPRPFGLPGYALVAANATGEELFGLGLRMRSVHHILEPLWTFSLPAAEMLEALGEIVAGLEIPAMEGAESFRVTTMRRGTHPFTSIDVQRVAGAALQSRYGTPVDLDGYAVEVRVDLLNQRCLVSLQHTRVPLSMRRPRDYDSPAALKPNIAYAMLRLALPGGDRPAILDPFCGSGTILIEAAEIWPEASLAGSDYSPAAVDGARRNLAAVGLEDRVAIVRADARHLAEHFPAGHFDAIVTNPPYGLRVGRGLNFGRFYAAFLDQAATVLKPGGRVAILVLKRGPFRKALRQNRAFTRLHTREVQIGGVSPGLFILERRAVSSQ
jgi:putative N6-adenine-specific DNA methylase/tRNA (guanine6-N2)-methyltransferase